MTLTQAKNEFVEWGMAKYCSSTVRTYSYLVGQFLLEKGDVELDSIDPMDIARYHAHLKSRGYSDSTIAYNMIALRQFFKFLFMRGILKWDYSLISVPKYISKNYKAVTAKEAGDMINQIKGNSFMELRDKAIIAMLFSSGVRVSELCDIELKDIDIEKGYSTIVSKKNRQIRMVFWDANTGAILKEYIDARTEHERGGHLFVSLGRQNYGKKLTTRSVERIIVKYRKTPQISPHSFRHGLGMRAVQSGIHPRYIQTILGHKNINSSQVYMSVTDPDVQKAYKQIGSY